MITPSLQSNIPSSVASTNMTIETNAHTFKMLTTDVYTDLILAPMREWSTNAIDACKDAGKPINFDVHLPTPNELTFSVRDYGTGMSVEIIEGLFSTLGASSKRNSNDFNGTLGIGRMSGLAYATSFNVESYHNGTYYSYLVTLQNGLPATVPVSSSPTTEPNGVRMSLTVKPEDIYKFKDRATDLYRYFETKPNLNVELDLNLDIKISGENWFSTNSYNNRILMANVAYTIPRNSSIDTRNFTGIVFKMPNGSVQFNPGRETLSLDPATVKTIEEAFVALEADMLTSIDDSIIEKNTLLEQLDTYNEAYSNLMTYSMRNSYKFPINTPIVTKLLNGNMRIHSIVGNVELKYLNNYQSTTKSMNGASYSMLNDAKFVIVDMKTNFKNAILAYRRSLDTTPTLILLYRKATSIDMDTFVTEARQLLEDLGVPYVMASAHEVEKTSTASPRDSGIYISNTAYGNYFSASELAEDKDYWYVPLHGTAAIDEDYPSLKAAYDLLEDKKPLVGIPKKYMSLVQKSNSFTLARDVIKQEIEKMKFFLQGPNSLANCLRPGKFIQHKPMPADLSEAIKDIVKFESTYKDYDFSDRSKVAKAQEIFTLDVKTPDLAKDTNYLYSKYPLMDSLIRRGNTDDLHHYLKLEKHFHDSHSDEWWLDTTSIT